MQLLALCQSIAEDGRLAPEEIQALRDWTRENDTAALPGAKYLDEVLLRVFEDGRITAAETRAVHVAIEKVLPRDIRLGATQKRVAVEIEVYERNAPQTELDFMVAGTRYEGRSAVIERLARPGQPVLLTRDRANAHSRSAIEVRLDSGDCIGYVPEDLARTVAPDLDRGCQQRAWIKKIIGYQRPLPVIFAELYGPGATLEEGIPSSSGPNWRPAPPAAAGAPTDSTWEQPQGTPGDGCTPHAIVRCGRCGAVHDSALACPARQPQAHSARTGCGLWLAALLITVIAGWLLMVQWRGTTLTG